MRRLIFTILFCLSFYGLIAFIKWDINWGYMEEYTLLIGFSRFCLATATIILANGIYPLIKDK